MRERGGLGNCSKSRVRRRQRRRLAAGRTLQRVLDDPKFHQQLGRLAFGGRQPQMPFEHSLGIAQKGVERIGVGRGDGHLNLPTEFEPHQVDEGQADGAFEFAGRVEDEAAIGGREEARHGLADAFGEFFPMVVVGDPVGDIRAGGCDDLVGRRRRFPASRGLGFFPFGRRDFVLDFGLILFFVLFWVFHAVECITDGGPISTGFSGIWGRRRNRLRRSSVLLRGQTEG